MITFDDEVFALGLNGAGCNGVGDVSNRVLKCVVVILSSWILTF